MCFHRCREGARANRLTGCAFRCLLGLGCACACACVVSSCSLLHACVCAWKLSSCPCVVCSGVFAVCVCWCLVAAGLLGLPGHVGVRGGVRGGGAPRGLLRRPRVHGPLPVLRVLLAGGWGPVAVVPCRGTYRSGLSCLLADMLAAVRVIAMLAAVHAALSQQQPHPLPTAARASVGGGGWGVCATVCVCGSGSLAAWHAACNANLAPRPAFDGTHASRPR
jgi:hypothetical protein